MESADCTTTKKRMEDLVNQLEMKVHPEGGFYKEVYRSTDKIAEECLHHRFCGGSRSVSTAIYFLLESGNFSAFHRIKSDEVWHHYEGNPVEIVVIFRNKKLEILTLGKNIENGEQPLQVVPEGCWFASKVKGDGYAFVGCTVAPGFEFSDFELGDRLRLLKQYPEHSKLIEELTR